MSNDNESDAPLSSVTPPKVTVLPQGQGASAPTAEFRIAAHQSPIPPSAELIAYDDRFPGFGERIMTMAEMDQNHAIEMQHQAMQEGSRDAEYARRHSFIGLLIGGSCMVIAVVGGLAAIFMGQATAGAAVVASVFGALAYVLGIKSQRPPDD